MSSCACTGRCRFWPFNCSGIPPVEWLPGQQVPLHPAVQGWVPVAPAAVGCICPPGANKECENPVCPRKNPTRGEGQ